MSSRKGPERLVASIPEDSQNYIRTLNRYPSPDKPLTPEEIAEFLRFPLAAVRSILGILDPHHPPLPQVRHGQPPENERAFFLGLAEFGNFQINPVQRGRERFVVVATESANPHRIGVLERTIGQWGEVHHTNGRVKVYVGSEFDFMLAPSVNRAFLEAKGRCAAVIFGGLASRLSDRQNRLSCSNEDLLRRVYRKFFDHFGFSMGRFNVEPKSSNNGRVRSDTPVIIMKDPGIVIATLMQVKTVYTLPFLHDLNTLSEKISAQTKAMI